MQAYSLAIKILITDQLVAWMYYILPFSPLLPLCLQDSCRSAKIGLPAYNFWQ
jgi:hypothetical protein